MAALTYQMVTRGFTREFDGAIEASVDTNEGYHLNGYARGSAGDHYFVGFASHDETVIGGWSLSVLGAVATVAGIVLIIVRARLTDKPPGPPSKT